MQLGVRRSGLGARPRVQGLDSEGPVRRGCPLATRPSPAMRLSPRPPPPPCLPVPPTTRVILCGQTCVLVGMEIKAVWAQGLPGKNGIFTDELPRLWDRGCHSELCKGHPRASQSPSPYCFVLPRDSAWPAWSVEGREGLSQHWGPSEPFPSSAGSRQPESRPYLWGSEEVTSLVSSVAQLLDTSSEPLTPA